MGTPTVSARVIRQKNRAYKPVLGPVAPLRDGVLLARSIGPQNTRDPYDVTKLVLALLLRALDPVAYISAWEDLLEPAESHRPNTCIYYDEERSSPIWFYETLSATKGRKSGWFPVPEDLLGEWPLTRVPLPMAVSYSSSIYGRVSVSSSAECYDHTPYYIDLIMLMLELHAMLGGAWAPRSTDGLNYLTNTSSPLRKYAHFIAADLKYSQVLPYAEDLWISNTVVYDSNRTAVFNGKLVGAASNSEEWWRAFLQYTRTLDIVSYAFEHVPDLVALSTYSGEKRIAPFLNSLACEHWSYFNLIGAALEHSRGPLLANTNPPSVLIDSLYGSSDAVRRIAHRKEANEECLSALKSFARKADRAWLTSALNGVIFFDYRDNINSTLSPPLILTEGAIASFGALLAFTIPTTHSKGHICPAYLRMLLLTPEDPPLEFDTRFLLEDFLTEPLVATELKRAAQEHTGADERLLRRIASFASEDISDRPEISAFLHSVYGDDGSAILHAKEVLALPSDLH